MIYVTGDFHGGYDSKKLTTTKFPEQKNLTKKDYVIICGDFGCIWDESNNDKYWLNWLNNKNFTTLFVDGNHENFNLLYNTDKYPIIRKFGGNVRQVAPSVFHLMRGEIYTIDNKRFFTFGGAESIDKMFRKENKSWWSQELPTNEEINNAIDNLANCTHPIDYVITHCAPDFIVSDLGYDRHDYLTRFFDNLCDVYKLKFKHWYFGHYHIDKEIRHIDPDIDKKFTAVYNKIIALPS